MRVLDIRPAALQPLPIYRKATTYVKATLYARWSTTPSLASFSLDRGIISPGHGILLSVLRLFQNFERFRIFVRPHSSCFASEVPLERKPSLVQRVLQHVKSSLLQCQQCQRVLHAFGGRAAIQRSELDLSIVEGVVSICMEYSLERAGVYIESC
jgi:hypothetical protein